MKTSNKCLLTALVALGVAMVSPRSVHAQNAPSGSINIPTITDPANAVWDVDSDFTNIEFSVTSKDGDTTVSVSCPVSVSQSGSGKFSGSGNTPVQLDVDGVNQSFSGSYKVTGTITSNKGRGRGSYNAIVSGIAQLEGKQGKVEPHKVTGKQSGKVSFDNVMGTATTSQKDTASASGMGSISSTETQPQPLSSVFAGDGSWTLVLNDLATDSRNKILGTATVTLNTGQVFRYGVRGVYKTKDGSSKLLLKALDLATKGSTLLVGMNGNTVTTIKGKITGQMVNISL